MLLSSNWESERGPWLSKFVVLVFPIEAFRLPFCNLVATTGSGWDRAPHETTVGLLCNNQEM